MSADSSALPPRYGASVEPHNLAPSILMMSCCGHLQARAEAPDDELALLQVKSAARLCLVHSPGTSRPLPPSRQSLVGWGDLSQPPFPPSICLPQLLGLVLICPRLLLPLHSPKRPITTSRRGSLMEACIAGSRHEVVTTQLAIPPHGQRPFHFFLWWKCRPPTSGRLTLEGGCGGVT